MRTPSWDDAVLDAKRICAALRRRECHSYQFADGFDNYNNAASMYTVNGTINFSSSYARFAPPSGLPGQGIKFASSGAYIERFLLSNQATVIFKVAVQFGYLGSQANNPFFGFGESSNYQFALCVTPNGALSIIKSTLGASVQIATGPGLIQTGLYYNIEAQVTISNGFGTAQVWVNGVEVINGSGLTTQFTSNAYASWFVLGDINNNALGGTNGMLADDLRVWDNTGSTQNAALGTDSRLVSKLPSGAGALTNWTPNGAAANWQCVDDNPPDGDTTYVSGATVGLTDAYAMPSAGFTAAPAMVVARSYVRKDDGATRTLQVGVDSSGATGVGPSFAVGSTYQFLDSCIALDPHTSAAWTAAGADAAQHYKYESA